MTPPKGKRRPFVAISLGCPSGIGPEVAVAAAASRPEIGCLLVGAESVVRRAAEVARVAQRRLVRIDDPAREAAGPGAKIGIFEPPSAPALGPRDAPFGKPTQVAGRAQLAWIDAAAALAGTGVARALVTGPVSKHAIASSSRAPAARRFRGHTEHLARLFGADEVVMAFWSEDLTIALVTTHLPLRAVARALTREGVGAAAFHTARLAVTLGNEKPRVAVCGVNPHAGEQGLLGDEEERTIAPGIALARKRLARARIAAHLEGPIGAETAIRLARAGHYASVVAMYHDQATIPMKLIGFGDAVNVTLGLPIVRTSVDHGTAYNLAGTGRADHRGMSAALLLADRLGRR